MGHVLSQLWAENYISICDHEWSSTAYATKFWYSLTFQVSASSQDVHHVTGYRLYKWQSVTVSLCFQECCCALVVKDDFAVDLGPLYCYRGSTGSNANKAIKQLQWFHAVGSLYLDLKQEIRRGVRQRIWLISTLCLQLHETPIKAINGQFYQEYCIRCRTSN